MKKWLLFILMVTVSFSLAADYDRTEWGGWEDADGDCQDTRTEALIRDNIDVNALVLDLDNCRVVRGLWVDKFDNELVTNPRELDLDHTVPLKHVDYLVGDDWTIKKKESMQTIYVTDTSY